MRIKYPVQVKNSNDFQLYKKALSLIHIDTKYTITLNTIFNNIKMLPSIKFCKHLLAEILKSEEIPSILREYHQKTDYIFSLNPFVCSTSLTSLELYSKYRLILIKIIEALIKHTETRFEIHIKNLLSLTEVICDKKDISRVTIESLIPLSIVPRDKIIECCLIHTHSKMTTLNVKAIIKSL
jgi:hypothetical protein